MQSFAILPLDVQEKLPTFHLQILLYLYGIYQSRTDRFNDKRISANQGPNRFGLGDLDVSLLSPSRGVVNGPETRVTTQKPQKYPSGAAHF